MDNPKLFNISKNWAPRSITRVDMRVFPFFDFEKGLFLLRKLNLVCRPCSGHRYVFSGFRLLNLVKSPHIPQNVGFSGSFPVFWVCSSHIFPPNWMKKLKFGMLCICSTVPRLAFWHRRLFSSIASPTPTTNTRKCFFTMLFSLIFYAILSTKTKLLQSIEIDQWRMSGNIRKICFKVLEEH